jgi:hypothetical protein
VTTRSATTDLARTAANVTSPPNAVVTAGATRSGAASGRRRITLGYRSQGPERGRGYTRDEHPQQTSAGLRATHRLAEPVKRIRLHKRCLSGESVRFMARTT